MPRYAFPVHASSTDTASTPWTFFLSFITEMTAKSLKDAETDLRSTGKSYQTQLLKYDVPNKISISSSFITPNQIRAILSRIFT